MSVASIYLFRSLCYLWEHYANEQDEPCKSQLSVNRRKLKAPLITSSGNSDSLRLKIERVSCRTIGQPGHL